MPTTRSKPIALIVEDSDDHAALLGRFMQREGFEPFAVANAESAIAAFDRIDPQIAIVDLLLPGVSGRECAELIRARFPECFLIVSSVLDAVDHPSFDAVLPKPVTGARLHAALERRSA